MIRIPAGKSVRIHVNQLIIKANGKHGRRDHPLSAKAKRPRRNEYGSRIIIRDPETGAIAASVVYQPDDPMECGAKVWIETEYEVEVID